MRISCPQMSATAINGVEAHFLGLIHSSNSALVLWNFSMDVVNAYDTACFTAKSEVTLLEKITQSFQKFSFIRSVERNTYCNRENVCGPL